MDNVDSLFFEQDAPGKRKENLCAENRRILETELEFLERRKIVFVVGTETKFL